MKFKFNLKYIRKIKGISQKQLAQMTGLSQSHISELELEKESPSLKTLELICTALKVHPEELVEITF